MEYRSEAAIGGAGEFPLTAIHRLGDVPSSAPPEEGGAGSPPAAAPTRYRSYAISGKRAEGPSSRWSSWPRSQRSKKDAT